MEIAILPIPVEDKPALRHLMQLYLYDFSEFEQSDVDYHGLYDYPYIDQYWTEAERTPLFVRVDGRLAGFALVREVGVQDGASVHSIAEFFVMRKYRRRGVGSEVAAQVFDRFPGWWSVAQETSNLPAQAFWRKVIGAYTGGDYVEIQSDDDEWKGPVQKFHTRKWE